MVASSSKFDLDSLSCVSAAALFFESFFSAAHSSPHQTPLPHGTKTLTDLGTTDIQYGIARLIYRIRQLSEWIH